jgi:hypothetical protein
MKASTYILLAAGLISTKLMALEAPQKIEPLAPNQAPKVEEAAPAAVDIAPANEANDEVRKPVEVMPQEENLKAYLGVGLDPVPAALTNHLGLEAGTCAMVRVLDPNGPAAGVGLQESDIITGLDGDKVKCHDCLSKLMDKHQAGDEVKLSFIHRGEKQEKLVKLGARPAEGIAGINDAQDEDIAMPDEVIKGLPKELRDAIEKNFRALGIDDAIAGADVRGMPLDAKGHPELQKQVEKMMKRMQLQIQPGAPGEPGIQVLPADPGAPMMMKSTLKMMDNEGNIEITRDGESCEAKVFDQQGQLLWSGPYVTPQDKAAIPPPIRERLDALNVDTNGKGIQLRMLPKR